MGGLFVDFFDGDPTGERGLVAPSPDLPKFTLGMKVGKTPAIAVLTRDGKSLALNEPDTIQPATTDYGIAGDCQTCTLFLSIGSQISVPNSGGTVKARLSKSSKTNMPMIVIEA